MSAIYSFHDVWHTEDQVPFDAHQHIDNVFEAHGKYCAVELESLTHREDPRTRALAKEGKVMEMDRDDFAAIRIGGELVCMDCTEEGDPSGEPSLEEAAGRTRSGSRCSPAPKGRHHRLRARDRPPA